MKLAEIDVEVGEITPTSGDNLQNCSRARSAKCSRKWYPTDQGITMRAATEELRYLVPQCAVHSDGCGPILELSPLERGSLLVLTVDINQVLEHEMSLVSIWGSQDAENWGRTALMSFTPKYYCGLYSTLLSLAAHAEIRYIRAQWRMQPLKKATKQLMFGFHITVEQSGARISARSIDSRGHRNRLIKATG